MNLESIKDLKENGIIKVKNFLEESELLEIKKKITQNIINKGINFGINDFGKSAPYKKIYNYFGLTVENIAKKTKEMINK